MDFEVKRQKILEVFSQHSLAVIATADKHGKPESALVGFNHLHSLEIIFGTFLTFRKYKNLLSNPQVAFVIGWDHQVTVQVEGAVYELSGTELTEMQEKYLEKYPKAHKYLHHSEERLFKVSPSWLRYTNLSSQPEEIFEIKF